MNAKNPYAPPEAAVADVVGREPSPQLWNPNAAASWSLLFSPIFGSILHMKNWQAIGDAQKAATSKNWAIGSAAFFVLLIVLSVVVPESKGLDALSRGSGIGLLVAWYYAIGKSQQSLVLARYGKDYPRKGWAKPIGIAILGCIAFIVVAGLLGLLIGMVAGTA
ncbi:hypothetical protein [Roseateles asaccharophilus]|uniref:Uncharacterized protein n=1 Tax=Roseateles asaccharophilus TaxID=582607 RepID=A0ABU2AG01_9BURK|nr:hypothetical protein [Roseateles asaccharophilus]MDR7336156.1 hypothetical protein [Roseateles asaccharophilus]